MNLSFTCSFRAWTQGGWCSGSYTHLPASHDSAHFWWCKALCWLLRVCVRVNVLSAASPQAEASWLACQHISRWFWQTVRCAEGRRQRWWRCHVGESFRSLWPRRWLSVCCHLQCKHSHSSHTCFVTRCHREAYYSVTALLAIMECKPNNEMQTWFQSFLCSFRSWHVLKLGVNSLQRGRDWL